MPNYLAKRGKHGNDHRAVAGHHAQPQHAQGGAGSGVAERDQLQRRHGGRYCQAQHGIQPIRQAVGKEGQPSLEQAVDEAGNAMQEGYGLVVLAARGAALEQPFG